MPNFDKLKPHFEALNLGGKHFDSMDAKDSQDLYDINEQGWDREKRDREILSEEIIELAKKYYPSQSTEDKQRRVDLMEQFFGTRSWSKISSDTHSDKLRSALAEMRIFLEKEQKGE